MSNLIPTGAQSIFQKIELFAEYDPTQYQGDSEYSWISNDTLTQYHNDCQEALLEQYDDIAGELAALDENGDAIQLGPVDEDAFVMQPEDLTSYLEQGLTFEADNAADIFDESVPWNNIDMQIITGGEFLNFIASGTLYNTDIHPYPFTSMDWYVRLQYDYIGSTRYDPEESEYSITFHDLYRGPKDNIGDRGYNYYDPVDASGTGSFAEFDPNDASQRLIWATDRWTVSTPAQVFTYALDNGATGTINLNMLFEIVRASGKITTDQDVSENGTAMDLNGFITMPKYQWSEFTRTQSPNVLRSIEDLLSEGPAPKTTMYINAVVDSISDKWPSVIDALPNGEELDMEEILVLVKSDLLANKAVAQAKDLDSINRYAKTYLANRVFEAGATWALNQLGIDTQVSVTMTAEELSDINDLLIEEGITDFEEDPGYYNWANVPDCNSKDVCSQFSTAAMSDVKDIETMLLHPALAWVSGNFDFIEAEILTAKTEINKVI